MPTTKSNRKYAWIRDQPDPRDYLYQAPRHLFGLPRSVDLRPGCSAVEDQGQLGSCTGNATVGALEFLERKAGKAPFVDLSRLMAYYNGRAIEGTVRQDSGCQIRDVVKGLSKVGTCAESLWPYAVKTFAHKPTAAQLADAKNHKALTYHRIAGFNDMKACLAEGYPFTLGFEVFESFESDDVARTGIMPMPKMNERHLGGHAVLVVGYEDDTQQLIVRNSWGSAWGIKGYFKMPYAYAQNASLTSDFITIRK